MLILPWKQFEARSHANRTTVPTVYKYPIGRNPDESTKSISGGKQMTKFTSKSTRWGFTGGIASVGSYARLGDLSIFEKFQCWKKGVGIRD